MSKQMKVWLVLTVGLALLALGSACNNKPETGNKEETPTTKEFMAKGDEGTITGTIAFNGAVPAPKKIDSSSDAVCGRENPNLATEDTVVNDGKLANAFVYIKDGTLADGTKISSLSFKTPSDAVTLDQRGCHYVPHVIGIQANQTFRVTNSDPTTHNVHPTPAVNEEWNQTQASGAQAIERKFARAEILVPVKCNQHPWMKSYIGVMKHPFFAVSGQDGTFTIKGVPPGTYTVAAWHEGGIKGTEKTMQVTVAANGSATVDFSFGEATASVREGSLKVVPAIEVPMLGRH